MAPTEAMLGVLRPQAEETFLTGGGEMGAMMRAFDWTFSPLGPVTDWPPSLRMAVSLCLNSQFPTVIFWGPDLIMLYNDGYLPMLADKHPASLGQAAHECWSEIWSIVGPMLHSVLETGQATWSYDLLLPIVHNGAVGEHYFTFSYSPIRDEAGTVRGVFCPVTETTARLQGERREQALRVAAEAARDQVTHILESMSDSFVAFDSQWRIIAVNASAAEAMHHRREDLLGKVYWEEFPPARKTNLYSEFQRAMADRVPVEFESYYPPWERWYEVHAYPVVEGGLSVFFRDITERRQAEEAKLLLAAIVESSDDAIISKSLDGIVMSWNAGAERIYGYCAEEMLGQPILRLLPEERHAEEAMILERLRRGERIEHFETVRRAKDGRLLDMSVTISPLRDAGGRIIGASKVARDITARKKTEEARARLTTELQRINDELRQFSYIVSHDLNEPLRTISNFVTLLAREYRGKLDTTAEEYIDFVVDGAQRMQQMLADLLAYTRVSGPAQEFTAVDSEEVLAHVLTSLHVAITEAKAEITHEPLPMVRGNATLLGQVLQNLIGNALKFRRKEPLRIHVSAQRGNGHWRFAVRDNGIGIDPRQADRIFLVFQRLHTRSEYPGTGMGLAICKKIIERHGGRIWVESRLGEGSIFYFTIND
jgi:PAS domain S-box-containing protein